METRPPPYWPLGWTVKDVERQIAESKGKPGKDPRETTKARTNRILAHRTAISPSGR